MKFVLVMTYTHLGVVLWGIWAGLVISLLIEFPDLDDLLNCALLFCFFNLYGI